ncbi:lantibiotic dehydratase [Kitasatospora sp. NPDC051170]|uniref:lantibiotic dehydratase n=1 Tax=Kitasatospora sp. NPDC051170 TaxID=3364056 RepID=UPI00379603FC
MARGLYEPAGFALLRAPMQSTETFAELDAGPERLLEIAARPEVREALRIASPDLVRALERYEAGDGRAGAKADGGRRTERLLSGLARYLGRMSSRPTPFGAFAGVALVRLSETTGAVLDPAGAATQTRSDMRWLLDRIGALESDQEVLTGSRLFWNPLVTDLDDRFVLPYADVYGRSDNRAITIAATPMLRRIGLLCAEPVPFGELVDALVAETGERYRESARSFLLMLHESRYLLTDLRPLRTDFRPETHLHRLLAERTGPQVAAPWAELRDLLDRSDRARPGTRSELLREAARRQREIHEEPAAVPFHVDTRLGVHDPSVHRAIGDAAAAAVETLMRLGCHPVRQAHLAEYHERFVERYGTDTEVPVLELLDAATGLGAPATYTQPAAPRSPRVPPYPGRPDAQQRHLARLLADHLRGGGRTLDLSDEDVRRMTVWDPSASQARPLPAVDLFCQVQAASPAAIDAGEWQLVVAADGVTFGGRSMGRFGELLGPEAVEELRRYVGTAQERSGDAIHAEVNYQPTFAVGANVATHPATRAYEILVNAVPTVPKERRIPLSDLVVGATAQRFYLRSLRLGREVVAEQSHMLVGTTAPNAARFVLEASQDGVALPVGFQWHDLDTLPFLPRVRRGRVVLRAAQWNLRPGELVSGPEDHDGARFDAALAELRERWGIDRYVYVVQLDNRLLLDLDSALGRRQLHREALSALRDGSPAFLELHEMLPAAEDLWLRDVEGRSYVSELVVPVVLRAEAGTAPGLPRTPEAAYRRLVQTPERVGLRSPRRRFPPGGEWTYLKVYGDAAAQDELITGPLAELAEGLGESGLADRWFFIRYADPDPHLRVRLHARHEEAREAVLLEAVRWGHRLVGAGVATHVQLDTYEREIERYGGIEVITDAERLFSANSHLVTALLRAGAGAAEGRGDGPPTAEHLLVAAHHALYRDWYGTPPERAPLLPELTRAVREGFRADRRYLTDLLEPWPAHPHRLASEHRALLAPLFAAQRTAVEGLREAVRRHHPGERGEALEQALLVSLAHMQSNRLLGVDREREEHCYGLWRLALDAIRTRPAGVPAPAGAR